MRRTHESTAAARSAILGSPKISHLFRVVRDHFQSNFWGTSRFKSSRCLIMHADTGLIARQFVRRAPIVTLRGEISPREPLSISDEAWPLRYTISLVRLQLFPLATVVVAAASMVTNYTSSLKTRAPIGIAAAMLRLWLTLSAPKFERISFWPASGGG